MSAVIPTPEVSDSDFGAFAEAEAADAEKARAAKHYSAMAAEAAAMFEPSACNPWEASAACAKFGYRYAYVTADKMGAVKFCVVGEHICSTQQFTPAEARALAAELVKAAEALA